MMFPPLNIRWLGSQCGHKILKRGRWIQQHRNVLSVAPDGHGLVGQVRGSEGDIYKVRATVVSKRLQTVCTCPYDWSPVCKHAVALVLEYWGKTPHQPTQHKKYTPNRTREKSNDLGVELYWDQPFLNFKKPVAVRFLDKRDNTYVSQIPQYLMTRGLHGALVPLLTYFYRNGAAESGVDGYFTLTPEQTLVLFDLLKKSGVEAHWIDPKAVTHAALEYSEHPVPAKLRVESQPNGDLIFRWDDKAMFRPDTRGVLLSLNREHFLLYTNVVQRLAPHPLLDFLKTYQRRGEFVVPQSDSVVFYEEILPDLPRAGSIRVSGCDKLLVPEICMGTPILDLIICEQDSLIQMKTEFDYDGEKFIPLGSYYYRQGAKPVFVNLTGRLVQRDFEAESSLISYLQQDVLQREVRREMILSDDEYFKMLQSFAEKSHEKIRIHIPAENPKLHYSGGLEWNFSGIEDDEGWFEIEPSFIAARQKISTNEFHKLFANANDKNFNFWDGKKAGKFSIPRDEIQQLLSVFNKDAESKNAGHYRLPPYQLFSLYSVLKHSGKEEALPLKIRQRVEKDLRRIDVEAAPLPKKFCGELRDYQKAGYRWLCAVKDAGLSGILADDMGLGKTVQALALFSRANESRKKHKPHLVVAPTSVLEQWRSEAEKFTPRFKTIVYSGIKRKAFLPKLASADLVITSYAVVQRDQELLAHEFGYCVLDEAQMIKNASTERARLLKTVRSVHRLVLTGTPIENRLSELWSLFDFILPGFLGNSTYFKTNYETPIERYGDAQARSRLHAKLKPFVLRRLKSEVERELPPKTEEYLYCELNPAQKALYTEIVAQVRRDVLEVIDLKGIKKSHLEILAALTKLRQVCCHPALVTKGQKDAKLAMSAKMDLLIELMETVRDDGHKALVFSQFVSMLEIIKDELTMRGIPHQFLHGGTRDRASVIEKFMSDENQVPFFLISLKAGGFGLNLTAADYVIHYDPWWNPAVEDQATDRAHRIGQKRKVFVYKLIAKDTIEEKILKMQQHKKKLSDDVLGKGEMGFVRNLSRENLEELLS